MRLPFFSSNRSCFQSVMKDSICIVSLEVVCASTRFAVICRRLRLKLGLVPQATEVEKKTPRSLSRKCLCKAPFEYLCVIMKVCYAASQTH